MTEFKSQICTTVEQSDRLLGLGLKPETADMCWKTTTLNGDPVTYPSQDVWLSDTVISDYHFPAWSLHRLLSLIAYDDGFVDISLREGRYGIHYGYDAECYDNLYDAVISCIEALIEEKDFNKEYLV